ncbi:MAG: hypothetical protein MUP47_03730 [Phycisphaerae bacterium]|nr:hypothetical protein [Phycisphaerae bacterium]
MPEQNGKCLKCGTVHPFQSVERLPSRTFTLADWDKVHCLQAQLAREREVNKVAIEAAINEAAPMIVRRLSGGYSDPQATGLDLVEVAAVRRILRTVLKLPKQAGVASG